MSRIDRTSRRTLRRLGRDATLVNPSSPVRDDDHGDVHWQDESRTETTIEIARRGEPAYQRRADGIEVDVDALLWVFDDAPVTDGADDDETAATRVEIGPEIYVVRDLYDEDNGLYRCHCSKEG